MKKIFSLFLLISFTLTTVAQDKKTALKNVETYIKSKLDNPNDYSFLEFHELFEQPDAEKTGKELKTTVPIKYSLILTYQLKDSIIVYNYFHLDKDYNVVGVSTKDDMLKSTPEIDAIVEMMMKKEIGNPLDSIENSSIITLKNKKFKQRITYKKDNFMFGYDRDLFSKKIDDFFFGKGTMFPSDSPIKKMGTHIRNHLDTCKSTSVSIEHMLKAFSSDDSQTFINLFVI